jgi:hypothetical protein
MVWIGVQTDQKGSITRGDLQKGLLTLRVFKVTAKMVPFPRSSEDGIDRMDLLQFLVLCAWDDSLNEILSMERSAIDKRIQDSYNRIQDITRAALEEAVKSTVKSNADLKAQVLQGLTDLPDLFHTDGPLPPRVRGSQTDRSYGRDVKRGNATGRKSDGSQTDRTERKRDKIELKSELEKVLGVPERVATYHSQGLHAEDDHHLYVPARGRHEEVKPREHNHEHKESHKHDDREDSALTNSMKAEGEKLAGRRPVVSNTPHAVNFEGRRANPPGQTNIIEFKNAGADVHHHEVQALEIEPGSPILGADHVLGVAESEGYEDDW